MWNKAIAMKVFPTSSKLCLKKHVTISSLCFLLNQNSSGTKIQYLSFDVVF